MEANVPTEKKPYTQPVLTVFGDIRDITQIKTTGPRFDNNSMRAKTT